MSTVTEQYTMRWQQFWRNRELFWSLAEHHRLRNGSFPAWVFDFISIHNHYEGGHRLVSPICIVDSKPASSRPRWEHKTFETLGQAIGVARRLARFYSRTLGTRIHVVYCPTPVTDTKES